MEGREFGSKPGSGGAASASVRLGLQAPLSLSVLPRSHACRVL
jgi:hypothetical protein